MKEVVAHEGIIVEINTSVIKVSVLVFSACASCHSKSMCGMADQKDKTVEILFQPLYSSFKLGDHVIVQTNDKNALLAIFWAYIFPAILLIGILFLGVLYWKSEKLAIFLGLLSVIVYYGALYSFKKMFQRKFTFSIVSKAEEWGLGENPNAQKNCQD